MNETINETEDEAPPEISPEQRRARQRTYAQQAIALAMQGRWEDALTVNYRIAELVPNDPEASNRIGNALSELNRIDEAIAAYERTIEIQPTNPIALRNLQRLQRIVEAGDVGVKASQKLPPAFFVEEVGKTGITSLGEISGAESIARVAAGDEVQLHLKDESLQAVLSDGTYLGRIEQGLAERLIRLMNGGNQYQAGVVMAEPNRVRILIRETVQSADNAGRISFPPRTAAVRAYTRESLLRRGADEDEDLGDEISDVEAEDIDEDDENPSEFGFSETSLTRENEIPE